MMIIVKALYRLQQSADWKGHGYEQGYFYQEPYPGYH